MKKIYAAYRNVERYPWSRRFVGLNLPATQPRESKTSLKEQKASLKEANKSATKLWKKTPMERKVKDE